MNWATFQTYKQSPERAFEILCNQLFENWCKKEYADNIYSFHVVNGSGGDGGVESYATLMTGDIVGLQAKWFLNSVSSSQIQQIKNSIKTAINIRPQIKRYIVCLPRDLSSISGKKRDTETKRWEDLLTGFKKSNPSLSIELWNETRITKELQEDTSVGIKRYWFEKSEFSEELFNFAFLKAKDSWLKTKYEPELNVCGTIDESITKSLGVNSERSSLLTKSKSAYDLCVKLDVLIGQLNDVLNGKETELSEILNEFLLKIHLLRNACKSVHEWAKEETSLECNFEINAFNIDFESTLYAINKQHRSSTLHFHISEITKIIKKLDSLNISNIYEDYLAGVCVRPILFLGDPGTGKTHGVAAVSDKLMKLNVHIPLVIQARSINPDFKWMDIISSSLGLSSSWSEYEIWQAMVSLVDRHRYTQSYIENEVHITPKVLIIIDGIDESAPYDVWSNRIREASTITSKYKQIRFCFTSRPFVFPKRFEGVFIKKLQPSGDAPTHELFEQYMNAYNITAKNSGMLKFALTTPLSLKLFCTLNQGKSVEFTKNTDVSIDNLLREKIRVLDDELTSQIGISERNQYVLKAIQCLVDSFLKTAELERNEIINVLSNKLEINRQHSETILQCLENYGILSSYCKRGQMLNPDVYYYKPGIQGYFDYAIAIKLIDIYKHPKDINFKGINSIKIDSLYPLSVIAMQKYNYLITRNATLDTVLDSYGKEELCFFALRHTSYESALLFKERTLELMSKETDALFTVTNSLILPLSRDIQHPLGVKLLDEFLFSFSLPAKRDLIWSIPGFLRGTNGAKWHTTQTLDLENKEYKLTKEDTFEGCPSIYVWALSTVNNKVRLQYRSDLMVWAKHNPREFYKLFIKYSSVNDPQIKSELFAILICLVYDGADITLIKEASEWMMDNILDSSKINENMDISIRYYAIAIVYKAVSVGLYRVSDISSYLPPYKSENYYIQLNESALSGTRGHGYRAIHYDLARYVLIDHFESAFCKFGNGSDTQMTNLINEVIKFYPNIHTMNIDQFILSAAYAYLLQTGWNEEEFNEIEYKEDGKEKIVGLDIAIKREYFRSTHGSKSPIMTVCEKYIWQFRNYLSGFFSDRLLYFNYNKPENIQDYGLLDDFLIPIQDIEQIDPDNLPDDRPWHIPEPTIAILDELSNSPEEVIKNTINAPNFDWEKWIFIDNSNRKYKVDSNDLLSLYNYSCFYGESGVETCIFINSIILDEKDVSSFIDTLESDKELSKRTYNPGDWLGGIVTSCYISPKEVCWFTWKKRYDSSFVEDFPDLDIQSAVDECCYNSPEYGDVHYELPSEPIRKMLGIVDSNGYIYFDDSKQIKAQYSISGEKWRTAQYYLLVDKNKLIEHLSSSGKTIIWIMREYRRESGKAKEKYGDFFATKDYSYIGYFDKKEFTTKLIYKEIQYSKIK